MQDAAAAALFTACKIEDTLKRSKEILCAAHNLKLSTAEQVTQDDPVCPSSALIMVESNIFTRCSKTMPRR